MKEEFELFTTSRRNRFPLGNSLGTLNRVTTPQEDKEIVRDYTAGASVKSLAPDYGVSHQTVINVLRRQGVPIRKRGRPKCT
jgi:Mor family transcriptional regulator